jgi:hypothetical protein
MTVVFSGCERVNALANEIRVLSDLLFVHNLNERAIFINK